MTLIIKNITKYYETENNKFYALKNINIRFPDKGLVSITGPSGCGKTTLLNLISLLDKPSEGQIIYKGTNINKLSRRQLLHYRNKEIGIIFQNYNLLENESVFTNIALPMQIANKKKQNYKNRVEELLHLVNLNKDSIYKKVNELSGGEKQRVAIARSLANSPSLILADEPTGALDVKNSLQIMEILKKISERVLVILVSHNQQLVNTYSDHIICINDGKTENIDLNKEHTSENITFKKVNGNKWVSSLSFSNIKKRKGRNGISIISLSFSLICTFIIIGFSIGANDASILEARKQLNYGVMSLSYEISSANNNQGLNLIRKARPSIEQIQQIKDKNNEIIIDYDLSYFFPNIVKFDIQGVVFENYLFSPVYSFSPPFIDESLLIKGEMPNNSINDIVINDIAYNILRNDLKTEPLNKTFSLSLISKIDTNLEDKIRIEDNFIFKENLRIVGVVKDFSFLSSPCVYYSYTAYKQYLDETHLIKELAISYLDILINCGDNDPISNYGLMAFLKDINEKEVVKDLLNLDSNIVFNSNSYTREKAFLDLIDASTIGLSLFLIVACVGSILIVGIISFSSYSDDRKDIAILYSLGANKSQVLDIYLNENLVLCFLSIIISLIFSPLLSILGNQILFNIVKIPNLITPLVPQIQGVGLIPTLLIITVATISSFFSTWLPIKFASGIKLNEELKDD